MHSSSKTCYLKQCINKRIIKVKSPVQTPVGRRGEEQLLIQEGNREKAILVACGPWPDGTVPPTQGEQLKDVACRMRFISSEMRFISSPCILFEFV